MHGGQSKQQVSARKRFWPGNGVTLVGQWNALTWQKPVTAALLNLYSVVAFFFAALTGYGPRLYFVVLGGVTFLASAGITISVDASRRAAEKARIREGADVQLALTDAFDPMMRILAEMQTKPSNARDRPLEKAVQKVLQSRLILFSENIRLRMVVYRMEPPRQGRKRRLIVDDHDGRAGVPRPFVSGDNGRGDATFRWLDSLPDAPKFVPDIALEDDEDWQGSGRGYKTFISAAILADGKIYGMLTVDAPVPGDLDETDVPIIRVLAGYLAIAYATPRS